MPCASAVSRRATLASLVLVRRGTHQARATACGRAGPLFIEAKTLRAVRLGSTPQALIQAVQERLPSDFGVVELRTAAYQAAC
jgi:hypothetical protein